MILRSSLTAVMFAAVSWAVPGGASASPAAPAEGTPSAHAPASAEMEFLAKAIAQTPFSALVIHTRVDIAPLPDKKASRGAPDTVTEERHTYHARVLETFRGKPAATIRYEMVVERGESADVDTKPQILTLCAGPRGFYWPGTGASFDAVQPSIVLARRVARETAAAPPQGYAQCK